MVANAQTDELPIRDLHLAWMKLEKRWDPKSREDKLILSQNLFGSKWKTFK